MSSYIKKIFWFININTIYKVINLFIFKKLVSHFFIYCV